MILDELKEAGVTCWIAGGSLRDYFMGIAIKTDHDLFFPNMDEFLKAREFFLKNDAQVKWESDNGMKVKLDGRVYDLVKKFFPNPQATIDEFDFTVSMFAIDTERVYHGDTSFIDLSKRQLMINKLTYPASSMSRAFRYYTKGFRMCMEEMSKVVLAIQEMPKTVIDESESTADGDALPATSFGGMFMGID